MSTTAIPKPPLMRMSNNGIYYLREGDSGYGMDYIPIPRFVRSPPLIDIGSALVPVDIYMSSDRFLFPRDNTIDNKPT